MVCEISMSRHYQILLLSARMQTGPALLICCGCDGGREISFSLFCFFPPHSWERFLTQAQISQEELTAKNPTYIPHTLLQPICLWKSVHSVFLRHNKHPYASTS